jgi:hypothetical protein
MFALNNGSGVAGCRTYAVPVCDNLGDSAPNAQVPAAATFNLNLRDSLDFSVDFSAWLGANGNPALTNAVWAVAVGSPKTPPIVGQAFSAQGMTTVVISAASGAIPGDAYWLDVTASIGATTPTNVGDVAIPARTIVRRIYIIVVSG